MGVKSAWRSGYTGEGVLVAVVDDGVNMNHPDLRSNFRKDASYDFLMDLPVDVHHSPGSHGTKCAGIIAGGNNNNCGVGAAYNANISSLRIFNDFTRSTDSSEASALSYKNQMIDIYSNSWGPGDIGWEVKGPGPRLRKGRQGKGSIFVFAAGNGGVSGDSCAFNGYVNNIHTIAISGVNWDGSVPGYTEKCAAIMAVTYGEDTFSYRTDGYLKPPVITSEGGSGCTDNFPGTSGSTAIASGIIALALQANPTLTWRDIQHLIVRSSQPLDPPPVGRHALYWRPRPLWKINKANVSVSSFNGFGLMKADLMSEYAKRWISVPKQISCEINNTIVGPASSAVHVIPSTGNLELTFTANKQNCGIRFLEHVQVKMNLVFPGRGRLKMTAESPSGTQSQLLYPRTYDSFISRRNFTNWNVTSLHYWGENPAGDWHIFQFMEVGQNGVPGCTVTEDAEEEFRLDLGLAAIPRKQMEEKIVKDPRNKHGNVTHIPVQLMEVILCGAAGVSVPNRVKEDTRVVLVHVPIPSHNTGEKIASGDWDGLNNGSGATQKLNALVNVLLQVDGGYSSWSSWSQCTKSCNGGYQRRSRTCSNPPRANGGKDCKGPNNQTRECNADPCQGSVGYTPWSPWLQCSAMCGGGTQYRVRICTNPPCKGNNSESQTCNTEPCPRLLDNVSLCRDHPNYIRKTLRIQDSAFDDQDLAIGGKEYLFIATNNNGETIVDVTKLTIEKLKEKLRFVDKWMEDWNKKPKKYLQEKLKEALKSIETFDPNELQHKRNSVGNQHVRLDKEINQPVAICFDTEGRTYVSTFKGTVYVTELHSNLVSLNGTVITSLQLSCELLYGIVSVNNVIYVSAHDVRGGVYRVAEFKENKIEKIASNGGSLCNRVHSLTNYSDHAIASSDTGDCKVKVINPVTKEYFVLVGDGQGIRKGSKAQLSQPTGICFDMKTLFTVDTSTGALRMTSSVNSLVEYLKYLHLFGETFGPHLKKQAPLAIEITPAVERLELVYRFDQECVDDVKIVTGTHGETQGPQGTVSSVVIGDERRLVKSLRQIKALLDRFSPGLSARFNIKSNLTLVVENTFSEMRTGASDMPLQLEFDYRFTREIKERLKRPCSTPYSYFTSSSSYYPHTFVSANYSELPKLRPPKTNKLTGQQPGQQPG
ncbi:Proprotein convertase subtilisin/kexin type 6 [Stylophora pistillata]|uniref:Proprotein convertase subtilisin/kexin type 6 n=1 Tax=Stylophora pistillata TaxID=50429 RepID=A0A2B4SEA1_STYPI|nr:Proprotein convertase subtilisin/kexin type 6 [Stylophora pistillata]